MSWISRILNVARQKRLQQDFDDEMSFHIESRIKELTAKGIAREEAERRVHQRFGSALRHRETSRDVKLFPWIESVGQDIRFGLRLMRKSPVFSAAAILSLALAIGANTGAFALLDALLLRPLPVRDPSRLVYLAWPGTPGTNEPALVESFSYPFLLRVRDAGRQYGKFFAMSSQWKHIVIFRSGSGNPEERYVQWISGNSFPTLGVLPALGRLLGPNDDITPGAHPVAVLSYAFWSSRFGKDPGVLGKWLKIDNMEGYSLQIVGVAQEGFTGVEPGISTDIWVPTAMGMKESFSNADWSWFRILGRLKNGVTEEQVRVVLQPMFTNFRRERLELTPSLTKSEVARQLATPLLVHSASNGPSRLRESFARPLWILGGVVGLVLLIACVNIANLLLARGATRAREMALRTSIGAGRSRLIQQVLIESALLALAASLLGCLLAFWVAPAIVSMMGTVQDPVQLDVRMNGRVLAFLVTLTALAAFLFGLIPALRVSGVAPIDALKSMNERSPVRSGISQSLVASQIAICFVVLFLSSLFIRTFRNLTSVDLGIQPNKVLLLALHAKTLDRRAAAWEQLRQHVGQLPGVVSAGLSDFALFSGGGVSLHVRIPGQTRDEKETNFFYASQGFLRTMGIPLLSGRDFTSRDLSKDDVAIVNQAFARRYFRGEDPVGKRFETEASQGKWRSVEIVGYVRDAKYLSVRAAAPPTAYLPQIGTTLEVRAIGDPLALAPMLRAAIPKINPAFRIREITTQSDLVNGTFLEERLLAVLSSFFAGLAMLLGVIGLYGVLSYAVIRRTKEIGIRVALGATRATVVTMMLRNIAGVVLIGVAAGLAIGLALARFVTSLLFEVQAASAISLVLPTAALLCAAALAAIPPAWKAARVDPMVALRYE